MIHHLRGTSLALAENVFIRAGKGSETTDEVGGCQLVVRPAPARGSRPRPPREVAPQLDRKSTRLNSSHVSISYAVFCLKKKNKTKNDTQRMEQRVSSLSN